MPVEPGFRTKPLTAQSTRHTEPPIEDYADQTGRTVEAWKGVAGKQGGDPAEFAAALCSPPR